ncbi:MAG: hypothetical protein COA45_05500 [Zetaproteobacteria bacterium]|nr:MAG: hypothetical protein COA45_05500 [Zetaproteobacteria bacterium]
MNILIIDDDSTDLMRFTHMIHDVDPTISIAEARDGACGIAAIEEKHYDCIFIDYFLPDFSGIEILKKIYNSSTDLAPCPVVMLTGTGHESVMMDAIRYGAQDYLVKRNISGESLIFAIKKAQYVFNLKSSQNEAKQKLSHFQKIEALGRLTGGIAHDFNNILTIILGNTRLLHDKLSSTEQDIEYQLKKVETINNAAERGADLVQHLMVFSHQRELKVVPTNINTTLNEMQSLLRRTIGKTVTIVSKLSDVLWLAELDTMQLEHMIINILANARDAMPDGGEVTIETQNVILDEGEVKILNVHAGEYVRMSISDTGFGIPEDIQSKIFDPFFTTKEVGKGTGLGMSIAYSFAKECGGTINLISEKNQGSTFEVYFPKSNAKEEGNQKAVCDLVPIGGSEIILVVEDELEINKVTSIILGQYGYQVLQASSADEALDILMDDEQEIDLLFTDIVMPGDINGVQLAARALVLRPELNIMFTTGFIRESIPDINLLDEYTVLNKPYKPKGLLYQIREVLDGS